ncbi:MAG: hypothetical protein AAF737_04565, partial [Pseudomonadota bacterium]
MADVIWLPTRVMGHNHRADAALEGIVTNCAAQLEQMQNQDKVSPKALDDLKDRYEADKKLWFAAVRLRIFVPRPADIHERNFTKNWRSKTIAALVLDHPRIKAKRKRGRPVGGSLIPRKRGNGLGQGLYDLRHFADLTKFE